MADEKDDKSDFIQHEVKEVEGWKVHVDVALLSGDHKPLGDEALRILANKLYRITLVLPKDRVARMQKVPIFLDHMHELRSMQYHPGKKWLTDHNYDPILTKAVHIPRASHLVNLTRTQSQPWVMLHELAHAYHDRELDFDYPPIRDAYDRNRKAGRLERVRHMRGHMTKHYALTNHKEFFAEMTESFIGTNDFYPFVRGELKNFDPELERLLERIWRRPLEETEPGRNRRGSSRQPSSP